MKIEIDIEETGTPQEPRFRPHLVVGGVETYLGTCYGKCDAIRDSLNYLQQELGRGDYSKFAMFKGLQR